MELKELQWHWNEFGKNDPLWAIVADPSKRNRRWATDEFFKSGEAQIDTLMGELNALSINISKGRCLDFGCGVGRLTQALCRYFDECVGVDIAPSMVDLARKYNRYGNRCQYYVNEREDLSLFGDNHFDFIYSILVLQHMQPKYSKRYIVEFLRVIKPGGLIVFQIPSSQVEASQLRNYALPENGFMAKIVPEKVNIQMRPGQKKALRIRVKNTSNVIWPATVPTSGRGFIRLGNHWLNVEGEVVQFDDGRSFLPRDVLPSEEVVIPLEVTSPSDPGIFVLELDMVQELVTWFKDKGSGTAKILVKNTYTFSNRFFELAPKMLNLILRAKPISSPIMELYGIQEKEIVKLILDNNGKVIMMRENQYCGDDWLSYTYFVTK